jgi:hypothetical protein
MTPVAGAITFHMGISTTVGQDRLEQRILLDTEWRRLINEMDELRRQILNCRDADPKQIQQFRSTKY